MAGSLYFLVGVLQSTIVLVRAESYAYTRILGDCPGTAGSGCTRDNSTFQQCKDRCDGLPDCKLFLYDHKRLIRLEFPQWTGRSCCLKPFCSSPDISRGAYSYVKDTSRRSCNQFVTHTTCNPTCSFTCPSGCDNGVIYGDGIYSSDSDVCTAAIHDGVISTTGGTVKVWRYAGQSSYAGTTRHGVTSTSSNRWFSSFQFEPYAYTKFKGDCGGNDIGRCSRNDTTFQECKDRCDSLPNCKLFLYDHERLANKGHQWTGRSCCPKSFVCSNPSGTYYSYEKNTSRSSCNEFVTHKICNHTCSFQCLAGCTGGVIYGDGYYSSDSDVCTAAVHYGVIAASAGGTVHVRRLAGQSNYHSNTRNGITSTGLGTWYSSITFDCNEAPAIPSNGISTNCGSGVIATGTTCTLTCSDYHTVSGDFSCSYGIWNTVKCNACAANKWGPACQHTCSNNCKEASCANSNGHCSCNKDWGGNKCDTALPKPVGSIVLESRKRTSFTIKWSRCSPDTTLTGYTIKYATGTIDITDSNTLTKKITGLNKGTQYTVTLTCKTSETNVGEKSTISKTVTTCKAPLVPQLTINSYLMSTDRSKAEIEAKYTLLTAEESGCDSVQDYSLRWQAGSSAISSISCGTSQIQCKISQISDLSSTYKVKLRVTNNAGEMKEGDSWHTVTTKTEEIPQPEAPIEIILRNATNISIKWKKCSPTTKLIGHIIKVTGQAMDIETSADVTSKVIDGLVKGTTYNITVSCKHNVWPSSGSYVRGISEQVTTCSEPTVVPNINFKVALKTDRTKAKTDGTFSPLTSNDFGCTSVQYSLQYKIKGNDTTYKQMCNTNSCVLDDLMPYTEYQVLFRVVNSAYLLKDSEWKSITTPTGVPSKTSKADIVSADAFSITVRWKKPIPNGIITRYEIRYETPSAVNNDVQTIVNSTNNHTLEQTIRDLTTNLTYCFQVRAYTSVGSGDWSDMICGVTVEKPPSRPLDFHIMDTMETNITFGWTVPERPNGNIINYKIQCTDGMKLPAGVTTNANTTYTLTGLTRSTEYQCSVSGSTLPGYGPSTNLTVWTLPEKPVQPVKPQQPQPLVVGDGIVTVQLPKYSKGSPQTLYEIIVHKTRTSNRKKRDIPSFKSENLGRYNESIPYYIAACLNQKHLDNEFVVGDGKTYNGYINQNLTKGATYDIWFSVVNKAGPNEQRVYNVLVSGVKAEKPQKPPSNDAGVIAGIVVGLVVVLIIAAVIGIVINRRRKKKKVPTATLR